MIPGFLREQLQQQNFSFITGVPDSIFKDLILEINDDSRFEHVITNNEGESCALAAGYHLATGDVPVVYLQNSGLGNCINPLTSLLDEEIYSIPALLLIGWRAVPGKKDEPQHKRMGAITPEMLTLLNIPYRVASDETVEESLQEASRYFRDKSSPYAILFEKGSVDSPEKEVSKEPSGLIRERILEEIVQVAGEDALLVTTTGKTSRELYEIRERLGQDHSQDFLTVGSMGCAATVALGIAMQQPEHKVILVDGDGACLMRMEAMATVGHVQPKNFLHILVDNNAYESTGSQGTQSASVDFAAVAKACNYRAATTTKTLGQFKEALDQHVSGPEMLVITSTPYSRSDLARPTTTPLENKKAFMERLLCRH